MTPLRVATVRGKTGTSLQGRAPVGHRADTVARGTEWEHPAVRHASVGRNRRTLWLAGERLAVFSRSQSLAPCTQGFALWRSALPPDS